jgi:hypothetical protein
MKWRADAFELRERARLTGRESLIGPAEMKFGQARREWATILSESQETG